MHTRTHACTAHIDLNTIRELFGVRASNQTSFPSSPFPLSLVLPLSTLRLLPSSLGALLGFLRFHSSLHHTSFIERHNGTLF